MPSPPSQPRASATGTPVTGHPAGAPAYGMAPGMVDAARPVTFESVREHPRVKTYVRAADAALAEIGYTEHGERHVGLVAHIAYNVLKRLGHGDRPAELAAIAGYLHDIGNAVNRDHHAQTSAV